jgi:hypothetical protein
MAIDRTNYNALVDDDGSNLVGTPWTKNIVKTVVLDPIDAEFTARAAAVRGVAAGGSGVATLAAHGVVIGEGTGAVAVTGAGTAGQVLTSNGAAADPTFQAPAGSPTTTAPTTTGTITAEPIPTGTGDLVTYHTNATLKTIQGMVAGLPGQRWTHISRGAGQVDFAHNNAGGTALGKLANFATVGLTSLAAGSGVATFRYDATATVWRLEAHEQGAWITPAYAAGNFAAIGGGTWTVDAGDVLAYKYRLSGRTLTLSARIDTSSVTATAQSLTVAIPAGLTGAMAMQDAAVVMDNSVSTSDVGVAALQVATPTVIQVFLKTFGNWAAATNTTGVRFTLTFEVQ